MVVQVVGVELDALKEFDELSPVGLSPMVLYLEELIGCVLVFNVYEGLI